VRVCLCCLLVSAREVLLCFGGWLSYVVFFALFSHVGSRLGFRPGGVFSIRVRFLCFEFVLGI